MADRRALAIRRADSVESRRSEYLDEVDAQRNGAVSDGNARAALLAGDGTTVANRNPSVLRAACGIVLPRPSRSPSTSGFAPEQAVHVLDLSAGAVYVESVARRLTCYCDAVETSKKCELSDSNQRGGSSPSCVDKA